MANITKRNGTYRIRISCGYDSEGKQRIATKTWIPPAGMSEKRIEKEVQRVAILFEEECRGGVITTAIKLDEFIDRWFTECANLKMKASTLRNCKWLAERVRIELGHMRLDKIATRDIQRFVEMLTSADRQNRKSETDKKLAPKTVKEYISFVSTIYDYAVKMQYVSKNPCRGVTLPRMDTKKREIFTFSQTQKLLEILGREFKEQKQFVVFIILAVYTGMRRGELLGLQWNDLDLHSGLISIQRAAYFESSGRGAYIDTPKTECSLRTLKISGYALRLLTEYYGWQKAYAASIGSKWNDNGWVFTNWCGDLMYTNGPERYFKKLCETNGLPKVTIHSLRHLNASLLIHAGLDIKTVQAWLGHSSATTTLNIYAHEFQAVQALASAAITDKLEVSLVG